MTPDTHPTETNWAVEYPDVDPIRVRDPVAEVLGVLEPGEPFVLTYEDVVAFAGHSCPTAAGAYRLAELGLAALYPDDHPVRGDVAVRAGGPRDDPGYGVTARIVSYVTGAAGADGFAGLVGGFGGRRDLLRFGDIEGDGVRFAFERTDTAEAVTVTYHVDRVPPAGPEAGHLRDVIEGTATEEARAAFQGAWHARVRRVLSDDDLFSVEETDPAF